MKLEQDRTFASKISDMVSSAGTGFNYNSMESN
jgi:hypothetical protein